MYDFEREPWEYSHEQGVYEPRAAPPRHYHGLASPEALSDSSGETVIGEAPASPCCQGTSPKEEDRGLGIWEENRLQVVMHNGDRGEGEGGERRRRRDDGKKKIRKQKGELRRIEDEKRMVEEERRKVEEQQRKVEEEKKRVKAEKKKMKEEKRRMARGEEERKKRDEEKKRNKRKREKDETMCMVRRPRDVTIGKRKNLGL